MMVMMFSVTGGATLVLHIILFRHATENGYYKCFLTALPNPYLDFDESDSSIHRFPHIHGTCMELPEFSRIPVTPYP